jgi:uncharacterized protein (DUF433 family)
LATAARRSPAGEGGLRPKMPNSDALRLPTEIGPTAYSFFLGIRRLLLFLKIHGSLFGMDNSDRITSNPKQCGGRPCIRGLRIRMKDILEMLGAGMSEEEILADYDYLESEDIRAALQFASKQSDHPILRAVS